MNWIEIQNFFSYDYTFALNGKGTVNIFYGIELRYLSFKKGICRYGVRHSITTGVNCWQFVSKWALRQKYLPKSMRYLPSTSETNCKKILTMWLSGRIRAEKVCSWGVVYQKILNKLALVEPRYCIFYERV